MLRKKGVAKAARRGERLDELVSKASDAASFQGAFRRLRGSPCLECPLIGVWYAMIDLQDLLSLASQYPQQATSFREDPLLQSSPVPCTAQILTLMGIHIILSTLSASTPTRVSVTSDLGGRSKSSRC